ncbi:uncharacterized protein LOC105629006 [Jatropha curcas]|uniref:uncharacterized protein LOC105629006 n=1 Tax=Jatropha curcas TaxID=180498 RepID=UPI0005FBC05D|nr:uncharacterized protein LOC105629006 [Jatropha curcas]
MVTSWILNVISKDLVEAFLYTTTAHELWSEIKERLGESDGPLIYQIQRKIASISQENDSVSVYYTKLKKLWDELASIDPLPACTCGASKAIVDIINRTRLMQFLMGLHDGYDQVRNQLLLLDPFPTINKANSMILQVESQRLVVFNFVERGSSIALLAKHQSSFKSDSSRITTNKAFCDYCHKPVYVDDVLITGIDSEAISAVKLAFDAKFTTKDLGYLKYFLGLEVARSDSETFISQRKFILDTLTECGLSDSKPASFV